MEVQWERQIIRAPYQKPVSVVRGEYTKTDDMHETWVIPGQTPATGEDSLAGALANVAGVAPEFTGRLLESGDYRSSGVTYAWAAWPSNTTRIFWPPTRCLSSRARLSNSRRSLRPSR